MSAHHPLYEQLVGIVGKENVTDEKFALWAVYADAGIEQGNLAGIIVKPQTTQQVSLIVKLANRTKVPITIRGGGSGMPGGCSPYFPGGILMDMTDMNKIIEINEDTMVATAQAGVTFGALIKAVHEKGLDCCYGGHAIYSATLGGSVATLTCPIGAAKYGAWGEEIVCLEVVLPTGDVIRTGSDSTRVGGRFHRYGSGPDLTGMFIGDQGVLGIKTEVSVRLRLPPEAREFETYCFDNLERGTKACMELGKTGLIYDGLVIVGEHSCKQTSIKWPQIPKESKMIIMVSLEGDKETIAYYKNKLDKIAKKWDGTLAGPDPAKLPTFDLIGEHACKIRSYGVSGPINGFIPTYKLPKVATDVDQMLWEHQDLLLTQPDTGMKAWLNAAFMVKGPVVNFACRPSFISEPPQKWKQALEFWHELVNYIANQGSCPYWIGKTWTPYLTPLYRNEYYMFFKTLKQTLDPNNILNPGLFLF